MTDKQRIAFFKVFQRACARQGIPPGECEAWRHEIVREACGVPSLKAVDSGAAFDKLMAHVSRLAEDHGEAMRWGTAEGRRLARMAEAAARQCFEIAQAIPALAEQWAPGAIPYLRGILAQAGWRDALHAENGDWWLDLDLPRLHTLFRMLDTHRRRLLRRVPFAKWEELPDGTRGPMRLAFDLHARYVLTVNALLKVNGERQAVNGGGALRPVNGERRTASGAIFRIRFVDAANGSSVAE